MLETFKPFQKVVEGMRNSGLADMDPSAMMGGKGGRGGAGRGRGRGMPNMRQVIIDPYIISHSYTYINQ